MPHLLPNLKEWPIAILSRRRSDFVQRIISETMDTFPARQGERIELLQNATKLELRRIKSSVWSVDPPNQKNFWLGMNKTIREIEALPDGNLQKIQLTNESVRRIVSVYAEEIAGRFKPPMFHFARFFCNRFLSVLFNRFRTGRFGFWGRIDGLSHRIRVVGPVEKIRKLFDLGTIIIVPTHSSNLDSLLLGYAFDRFVGLPSPHYGAGLNLFNNELVGYFMNRLGAYKVDRRKRNRIYLDTLKTVSRIGIYMDVNSLFFPGGTRSRTGEIEQNLKLGLLTTVVQAQRQLFENNIDRKIFVVPLVINFDKVLEDRILIEDYFRKQGLSPPEKKKIKQKSRIWRFFSFVRKLFTDEMTVYLSIGEPMDVFGNQVNEHGQSLDKNSKHLLKKEYFMRDGVISEDRQREEVYTRHLSSLIVESYRRNCVVRLGSVAANALVQTIKLETKTIDQNGLIKLPASDWSVSEDLFHEQFQLILNKIKSYSDNGICLAEDILLEQKDSRSLLPLAIEQIRTYQSYKIIQAVDSEIQTDHIGLLMFYANRLECLFSYEKSL